MTNLDKEIAAIMELDKEREQGGEWKYISTASQGNGGIRNDGGYICFLTGVSRYSGQEERYEREIKERFTHGQFIAQAPAMVSIIQRLQAQLAERDARIPELEKAYYGQILATQIMVDEAGDIKQTVLDISKTALAAITKPTEE